MPLSLLFSTGSLSDQSSGPFRSLTETVQVLHKKGHRITVTGSLRHAGDIVREHWFPVAPVGFRRYGPFHFHFTPSLTSWLKGRTFDAVSIQTIWPVCNWIVARWAIQNHIPYMITPHGGFNPVALKVSPLKKALSKAIFVNTMVRHTACFHALNQAEYATMRAQGIRNPICVVPNGILVDEVARQRELQADVPPLPQKKICLYLGRITPIKNLATFIRAWNSARDSLKEWVLVMAGPSELGHEAELKRLVAACALSEQVLFVGPHYGPEKIALIDRADCFVLPSKSEGFPIAPLEAMACKKPVLLTRQSNIPEIGEHTAGLVSDCTQSALTENLMRMARTPADELTRWGENGYGLATSLFDWDVIARRFIEVFAWMKSGRDRPAQVRVD